MTLYEAQNELLTAMAAFGHGGSSLKTIDRLRLHLKNWERIRSDGATKEELFARLRETYVQTVVPELRHIVMLAHRAAVPDRIWDTLLGEAGLAAEETEAILSAAGEDGASGRPAEPGKAHIEQALGSLDAVDAAIAGIRAHLRAIFRTPVAEALGRLVERFRFEHGEKGVAFGITGPSSGGADVFISPVSFDKIFEALLTNAVRAVSETTGPSIDVTIQWEGDYCRVDVRDNGCGIPREDWENVFDRHYTTKTEGGGFGLYYVREELARFGGKIFVLESAPGSGTTMRAILRKSEKTGGV
jgi:hypothetical protein